MLPQTSDGTSLEPVSSAPRTSPDMPLYVVFNVASGSGDRCRSLQVMQDVLRSSGREHRFLLVHHPRALTRIARQAAQLAESRAGAVVVAGGDGTINSVAQATLKTGRPFGLVPQGTFNYTSRAHAISVDTEAATRALLDARPTAMQVGLVNDQIFLVNASLGLYPQLLQERETYKRQFGRYRAIAFVSALSTILHGNGLLSLELEHDALREVVRTPSVFVGNNALQLKQAGLPEADVIGRQQLVGVVLRASSSRSLFALLMRGVMGQLGETDALRRLTFGRMSVRPALRGVRKLKVALDGEVFWMKPPLVFSVSARPLWLLTPDPQRDTGS